MWGPKRKIVENIEKARLLLHRKKEKTGYIMTFLLIRHIQNNKIHPLTHQSERSIEIENGKKKKITTIMSTHNMENSF